MIKFFSLMNIFLLKTDIHMYLISKKKNTLYLNTKHILIEKKKSYKN